MRKLITGTVAPATLAWGLRFPAAAAPKKALDWASQVRALGRASDSPRTHCEARAQRPRVARPKRHGRPDR
jgi:hypothetical protein